MQRKYKYKNKLVTNIEKRLKNIGVNINTELGYKLKKLDEAYNKLEYHRKSFEQLKEDIEIMEHYIMHDINKRNRKLQWV